VPEFPAAYLSTISGRFTVSVRVKVDQSGAVVDAALDSRPNSRYFDRVSVEAARRWKFKPAGDGTTHLVRFDYSREGCAAR
jgi:TonB family protein